MATEPDGWLERLKAKVEGALAAGNRRLDELEAQRARERADKPWLSEEGEAPTLEQVRARIEWAERRAAGSNEGPAGAGEITEPPERGGRSSGVDEAEEGGGAADGPTDRGPGSRNEPSSTTAAGRSDAFDHSAAEREAMRIEMAERERASRERLDEIRRELGVDLEDDVGSPPGST